jgi:hypothetical protein
MLAVFFIRENIKWTNNIPEIRGADLPVAFRCFDVFMTWQDL